MDKTFLEKQIEKRAQKRLDETMVAFSKAIQSNEALNNLKIKIGEKIIPLMNGWGTTGGVLFNGDSPCLAKELTNIDEIKSMLLEKYIEEETDLILEKIGSINYLFEQQD